MKINDIICASINSSGAQYNRLRIKERDKELFNGLSTVKVKYKDEYFVNEIIDGFAEYGEIDNEKLSEWSNNQHVKVQIDVLNIKKGEIEIISIDN